MILGVLLFIFIGALLFLSWPDHIYSKMQQHAQTAQDNGGTGFARQATDKHLSQKKDDAVSEATGANESSAAVDTSDTLNNLNKVSRTKMEKVVGHFKIIIGKYSKRCRSNVAVIIVRIIFINSFSLLLSSLKS